MGRGVHKLTTLNVQRARKPGRSNDGAGLYLQITDDGGKSWVFRYKRNGRERWMGLGPTALVDLKTARELALNARRQLHGGTDPLTYRANTRTQAELEAAKTISFDAATATYIEAHRSKWRNGKHALQWQTTLASYASPIIGKLPVGSIDTALVLQILQPIWQAKPETASRLRGRIESVLGWAAVHGYRPSDSPNPARWKDHLSHLLPPRSKIKQVQHLAALPYAELPDFMLQLQQLDGIAPLALRFVILTACRTGDIIGQGHADRPPMRWQDVDLKEKNWVIPRTKTNTSHSIPLSNAAITVLQQMLPFRERGDLVFPGSRAGQPLTDGALRRQVLQRIRPGLTVHGFRSVFKDWCGECTDFPHDVIEAALSHVISDPVERAYRRGSFFEKRRRLMELWADFATGAAPANATVVKLRG